MSLLANEKYEDAVIGSLLWLDEVRPVIMPRLSPEAFTQPDMRQVFEAIQDLYNKDREIDALSVGQWLKDNRDWEEHRRESIAAIESAYQNHESLVDDLIDRKNKRELRTALMSLANDISNEHNPTSHFLATLERIIHNKVEDVHIPGLTMSEIEERDKNQPKFEQIYTGDKFFDYTYFGNVGSRKGQFEVILGRPKHGKTHFALWRTKQYVEQGYKGLFFTMESNDREIYNRLRGYFGENNDNVKIIDKSGVSNLAELIQTTKYWKAAWGIDFIVADYLQRIPVEGINYHDETKRIVTCSNFLTDMAIKENVLCLGLAQPSNPERASRKGYKMEPEIWDIYGSGAIEKDAFMVTSIFRPSEIEELQFLNYEGELRGVKAPGSDSEIDMLHKNTVFVRQKIVREGTKYMPYVKFIHTDNGLERKIIDTHNIPTN